MLQRWTISSIRMPSQSLAANSLVAAARMRSPVVVVLPWAFEMRRVWGPPGRVLIHACASAASIVAIGADAAISTLLLLA